MSLPFIFNTETFITFFPRQSRVTSILPKWVFLIYFVAVCKAKLIKLWDLAAVKMVDFFATVLTAIIKWPTSNRGFWKVNMNIHMCLYKVAIKNFNFFRTSIVYILICDASSILQMCVQTLTSTSHEILVIPT